MSCFEWFSANFDVSFLDSLNKSEGECSNKGSQGSSSHSELSCTGALNNLSDLGIGKNLDLGDVGCDKVTWNDTRISEGWVSSSLLCVISQVHLACVDITRQSTNGLFKVVSAGGDFRGCNWRLEAASILTDGTINLSLACPCTFHGRELSSSHTVDLHRAVCVVDKTKGTRRSSVNKSCVTS